MNLVSYLADDSELGHGVANAEEGVDGLGLLANGGLVNLERQPVMGKVRLHLVAIKAEDVLVRHGQNASPLLVAIGQPWVLDVKDAIHKGEVVGDLLVTLDVEALRRLRDGCFEIRHGDKRVAN